LLNAVRKKVPLKPNALNLKPELSSKCADLRETTGHFNAFLRLSSIGKSFGHILLPIKHHRHSNRLKQHYAQLNSFLISDDHVELRYEIPHKTKISGVVVGADQGLRDLLTFSNGVTTPNQDNHGHTLCSITKKLSRQTGGSRNFKQTQDQRKNFINWSINQIDFSQIKQINFEEIMNINYGKHTSRYLSHWTNTLIRDKLFHKAEEQEVLVVNQPSAFYSQRCSSCGLVCKANRKGKQYSCSCGSKIDSDLNAAKNHEQELYYLDWALQRWLRVTHKNTGKGFYWNKNGLFETTGEALGVPPSKIE